MLNTTLRWRSRSSMAAATMGSSKILPHEADGPFSETWAILCSHRLDPGVGEHSVNPCLVAGARYVISGRESAVQRAERPDLLRFTRSVTAGAAKPTGVLTIASRRSAMTELLRRETGGRGEARTPMVVNLWRQAAGRARVPCSVGLQLWIANSRQVPGTPFNS